MQALRRITGAIVVALTMTALAGPVQAAEAGTMSAQRAGNYYLKSVCPSNEALARFSRIVWGKDNTFYAAEFQREARRESVQTASARYARAEYRFAQRLELPPAAWPANVRRPVRRLTDLTLRVSNVATAMSSTESGYVFIRRLNKFKELNDRGAKKARIIRLRLGLPINGEGCP